MLGQSSAAIRRFFGWWLGQLIGLIPGRMKRLVEPSARLLVIDLSSEPVVLQQWTGTSCREIGRIDVSSARGGEADTRIRELIQSIGRNGKEIGLRLPQPVALRAPLELPAGAEAELRGVLQHQIDRHTPFSEREAYFGYEITARRPDEQRLDVELTVVPRRVVDGYLQRAASWGVVPSIVDVGNRNEPVQPSRNLIADAGSPVKRRGWQKANAFLLVLLACLMVAAVYVPLQQRRDLVTEIQGELSRLQRESREVLELRDRHDALLAEARFLAEKRSRSPRATAILSELTDLLPDDTWLFHLEISRPEIQISGYAPAASALIETIDGSAMFRSPRFRSPVVRPRDSERERFNLSFELEHIAGGE